MGEKRHSTRKAHDSNTAALRTCFGAFLLFIVATSSSSTTSWEKKNRVDGRKRTDERMICLSGQQTAGCQILITISFPLGGQFKAFPFRFRFLFSFFVQIHRPTATSRETCPRVYSDTVPRCPGWAPHSLESGVTFHTSSQSSHTHRLWKNAVSLFFFNLSQHRLKSFFVLRHVLRAIYEEYPCHHLRKYVQS